ncbi:MAG: Trk family potassium uptake protein [Chloroflexi bacterium]|nr:Trk family potassium uptake protein [Chloroflexota bacterium]
MPKAASHNAQGPRLAAKALPAQPLATEEKVPFHPSWALVIFFALLVALGTLLLWLPGAAAQGQRASLLDALFTATSAATGTGLIVRDTASFWSATGQKVLLVLMQVGGLGALAGSTIFLLLIARKTRPQERSLFKEAIGVQSPWGMAFLVLSITLYALLVEAVGAYLLAARLGASLPTDQAWWLAIFHSASAFNNAGFEIMDMANHLPDSLVQLTLLGLSVLGAISFIVIVDLLGVPFRRPMALDTRLVLLASSVLLVVGAAAILLAEASNPQSLGNLPLPQRVLSALFHSASARTAGLSTLDLSLLAPSTLLLLIALMFVGGASGSTAGGIKVNTLALLAGVTWSFVKGNEKTTVLGKEVREGQVYRALAIAFLSLILVFAVTFLIGITEGPDLLAQFFETVSAFSTTGFSLGITPTLSTAGKLLIIFTMFAGRVGPLTLAFALAQRQRSRRQAYTEEAINLG